MNQFDHFEMLQTTNPNPTPNQQNFKKKLEKRGLISELSLVGKGKFGVNPKLSP